MTTYKIYRVPGRQAERRREQVARVFAVATTPQPRRMKPDVEAESQRAALAEYVDRTYVTTSHPQYASHRFEWCGTRSFARTWRPDDGNDNREREWSVVVELRNGQAAHDVRFLAWRL